VRIGLIQGTRVGERRELHQIEAVALSEAPLEVVGLAEVEPGVQENYRHGAVDPADQVRQDHPATAEAHREGNLGREGLYRPGERRRGIRPGQHGGALAYLEGAKHPIRSLGSPARPGDRLPSPRSWRRLHAPCRPPAPARAALRRDPRPLWRFWGTSSTSSASTSMPWRASSRPRAAASVDLPAPDRPVSQRVKPRARVMRRSLSSPVELIVSLLRPLTSGEADPGTGGEQNEKGPLP